MPEKLYAGLTYEQIVRKYSQTVANVCIFKNGEVADRNVGFASPDAMREFVERNK